MDQDDGLHHPAVDLVASDPACPTPTSRTSLQKFLSATLFDESGVCMLHIARHFNGIGLASKLSNETLAHRKKLMAAELLQLDGNLATFPSAKAIFDGHHNE
ncbi:uncharacterized protein [Triticum aestivum]|uniref:uncharacterized protein n=1 Tax=Triticum aestivum TaxID=4565 RepID=UPI001D007D34|nr:uncharacterized protein LOC123098500 [Triticum aestivum]